MVSTAGSNKNAVLTEFKSQLNSIAEFTGNVFKGFRAKVEYPRAILIHLTEDNLDTETSDEAIHRLILNVLVKLNSDLNADPEAEIEDFVEKVGLVEDKLKSIANNPPKWEHLRVLNINYTFGQAQSFVYYSALLKVEVRLEW